MPNKSTWSLAPPFQADGGKGWRISLPADLHDLTDTDGEPRRSALRLCENGRPIGEPHALHDKIRDEGGGRHSFWKTALYFSTQDASDPNANGRRYDIVAADAAEEEVPLEAPQSTSFDPRRLPFICNDVVPLVFRKSYVSWKEILPDFEERRPLLSPLLGVYTFPSAGALGTDLTGVHINADGVAFPGHGIYNVLSSFGTFRFLILPADRSDEDLMQIGRFVANNTVHSGYDVSTCTYGKFTSSLINYRNLFHKLFYSDQPLGLLCCSAAFYLCALCETLGYEARRVHLTGPGRGGHFTTEVRNGDRWVAA
jgi:hypothetical protein